ncbi:DUF4352 domain-containing protein [Nonomuraea recticatena]|uniref:DUF4352 domain-containing protein n=1 Tax=Nonomuraea recticatena TaxID=46178 RepID=A0ABN3S3Y4_9ACTN
MAHPSSDPSRHTQPGHTHPQYGGPPRRKSNAPLILIVIASVLLLVGGGCAALIAVATGSGEPGTTAAVETGKADGGGAERSKRPAEPKAAGIGAAVRDGKFSFTVTKLERRERIGSDVIGADAQGVFLLVHVKVENIGDEAQTFMAAAQRLHAGGKQYEADSGASIYLDDAKSLYETINPGNVVKGVVLFDVPKTLKPETIELHDSLFSGGVRVSLAE